MWLESFALAWRMLRANRLRSALTALTVGLGACTMALLVSLATNALRTILTGVDAVGGREMIFVEPKDQMKPGAQAALPLTPEDAEALKQRVPGVTDVAYLMSMRNQPLLAGGKKLDVDVGMGIQFPFYITQEIAHGTLFDNESRDRNIVLSEPIAKELFGAPERAVGKGVVLWQERFTVTGVTRDKPVSGFNMGGVSRSRAVFIAQKAATQGEGMGPRGFIVMRDDGRGNHDLEMDVAASVLKFRHRGADDVEFFDMRAFIRTFDIVFAGIRVVVALIAAVSLVIAGAGIMNVMLASIRQRITEIGIRRAVGASQTDIRRQFLVEAVLIATLGGVTGSALGVGLAALANVGIRHVSPSWCGEPSWLAAAVAVVSAGGAGLVFGLRPAQRASGLWVVECLRGVGG
jgi:putative ABC transport system permease protein